MNVLEGRGLYGAFLRYVMFASFVLAITVGGGGAASAEAPKVQDSNEVATKVICNVVAFVQKLGLPIMTGVILGSSIMAIFGKLAWPAIVMLVVFTAIFFGAGKLINKFAAGLNTELGNVSSFSCVGGGNATSG